MKKEITLYDLVTEFVRLKSGIPNLMLEDLLVDDTFEKFMDLDIAINDALNGDEYEY